MRRKCNNYITRRTYIIHNKTQVKEKSNKIPTPPNITIVFFYISFLIHLFLQLFRSLESKNQVDSKVYVTSSLQMSICTIYLWNLKTEKLKKDSCTWDEVEKKKKNGLLFSALVKKEKKIVATWSLQHTLVLKSLK